jgi:hypothetical protein
MLEVATVATDADRRHPLMNSGQGEAYDRFRAVHDILGHARLRLGFDRDGEFAVWLAQERFHSPLARRALATELHGQHSVRWTTGEMAVPKAALLDSDLLRRARLLSRGSAGICSLQSCSQVMVARYEGDVSRERPRLAKTQTANSSRF